MRAQHVVNHMVGQITQPTGADLHRQMPVAKMIRRAR